MPTAVDSLLKDLHHQMATRATLLVSINTLWSDTAVRLYGENEYQLLAIIAGRERFVPADV
jgi:hypothetical protein